MQKLQWFGLGLSLFVMWVFPLSLAGAESADAETAAVVEVEEVTVTALRAAKEPFHTPTSISVVNLKQLVRANADITPNLLRDVVGVIAQQTTVGQGSPMLRSLTGYQTLMQVDWVRLNNSTFRSGPNQYLSTIAPETLSRAEVLRGSSSVLYGSGAMGGVISLFSKEVPLNPPHQRWEIQPRVFARYTSATQERLARTEVLGAQGRFGFLIGGGARLYGDLNAGSGYDLHYKNRKFEVVNENEKPSGVKLFDGLPDTPPDRWLIDTETPLGWRAYDADAKIAYQLTDTSTLNVAYQMWRQPQTPRYDKIAPREFDEFYFEPQNRDLVYANYVMDAVGSGIDTVRLTASYHRQKEGRNEVQHQATTRRQRFDTVNTVGFSAQAISSVLPRQRLVGGGEFYLDTVQSRTVRTALDTNVETIDENLGRFINGSQFWDASLFLQDEIDIHERVALTLGGRATFYQTNALLSLRDESFDEFDDADNSLTGGAGIVVGLTESLNFVSSFATAFRAPSLNDTTAVEVTNAGVTAPSPDLEAETSWTIEGGLKAKHAYFRGALTLFHSRINGLVTRVPVEEAYAGETMPRLYHDLLATYGGEEGVGVYVFDNVDEAQLQGVELAGVVPLSSALSLYGNVAWMRGRVLLLNGEPPDLAKPWEAHIRREPPLNGVLGVAWEPLHTRFWAGVFVRGAMEQRRLNRSDIRDARIQGKTRDAAEVTFDSDGNALDAGTPGWWTLNLRGGLKLTNDNSVMIVLENLLNRRYREHGSGINAPGFNVSISLDNRF